MMLTNFRLKSTMTLKAYYYPFILIVVVFVLTFIKPAYATDDESVLEFADIPPQLIQYNIPIIEFLVDRSRSMLHISGPDGYDSSRRYTESCPEDKTIPTNIDEDGEVMGSHKVIRLQFSDNIPYFTYDQNDYEWGVSDSVGPLGHPIRCFDPTTMYSGILTTSTTPEEVAVRKKWTGNELNYIFKPPYNIRDDGEGGQSLKDMRPRLDAVKLAFEETILELKDSGIPIHVGLAVFPADVDVDFGAEIRLSPQSIIEDHTNIINSVNSILPHTGQGTPIGSAHAQIQRYMVEGYNETLNYQDQTNSAYNILSIQPENMSGEQSPLTRLCYHPYLVALTDGRPIRDINISPTLLEMTTTAGFGSSANLVQVASFAAQTDLRPSLEGVQNMPTYLIIFSNQKVYDSNIVKNTAKYGLGERYSANGINDLVSRLTEVLEHISTRAGSAGVPSFASEIPSSDNKICYNLYKSGDWVGDVACYTLDESGNPDALLWSANTKLTDRLIANSDKNDDGRTIITYHNGGKAFTVSNFNAATLKPDMIDDLNSGDGQGAVRLSLLRNLNLMEAGVAIDPDFREIPAVSDILSDNQLYIGKAISNWDKLLAVSHPDMAATYRTFVETTTDYPAIICSGSNSPFGRQCFSAETGDEVLAYIPGGTTGLSDFLTPNYQHRAYHSGPSVVEDATIGNNWKTLYLFCDGISNDQQCSLLDVTSRTFSETNATNLVIWEANDANIPALGNVLTIPSIMLYDSTPGIEGGFESISLLPNSYNSDVNQACLIAIPNQTRTSWVENQDYYLICDSLAGDAALTVRAVDSDRNGLADYIYLTTVKGRILRINIDGAPSTWNIDAVVANLGESGVIRPILTKPLVVKAPKSAIGIDPDQSPNLLVLVGTGRYLHTQDRFDTPTQYFVSILDDGSGTASVDDLVEQTLGEEGNLITATNHEVDFSEKRGSIVKFNDGFRVISPAQLYYHYVAFNVVKPGGYDEDCHDNNGDSKLLFLDVLDLSRPDLPILDTSRDNSVNEDDTLTNGEAPAGIIYDDVGLFFAPKIIGNSLYQNSDVAGVPQSGIDRITLAPFSGFPSGRRSWQELR